MYKTKLSSAKLDENESSFLLEITQYIKLQLIKNNNRYLSDLNEGLNALL